MHQISRDKTKYILKDASGCGHGATFFIENVQLLYDQLL